MNFVQVAGHLGADPEERFTPSGKRVVRLRVAARARRGKSAEEDDTIWWEVSIWDDKFDRMLPYLKKGSAVMVYGEMGKPETYADRSGQTRVAMKLTADVIKFSPFGKSERAGGESAAPAAGQSFGEPVASYGAPEVGAAVGGGMQDTGDDLPF